MVVNHISNSLLMGQVLRLIWSKSKLEEKRPPAPLDPPALGYIALPVYQLTRHMVAERSLIHSIHISKKRPKIKQDFRAFQSQRVRN